jgi:hypothetical protein
MKTALCAAAIALLSALVSAHAAVSDISSVGRNTIFVSEDFEFGHIGSARREKESNGPARSAQSLNSGGGVGSSTWAMMALGFGLLGLLGLLRYHKTRNALA